MPQISAIYEHDVQSGTGSFETEAPTLVEMATRRADVPAKGIRQLVAVIGDSGNAGSIGLHRSVGFTDVGVLKSCGWKFGQWLDVVLMEKALGFGNASPPPRQ